MGWRDGFVFFEDNMNTKNNKKRVLLFLIDNKNRDTQSYA